MDEYVMLFMPCVVTSRITSWMDGNKILLLSSNLVLSLLPIETDIRIMLLLLLLRPPPHPRHQLVLGKHSLAAHALFLVSLSSFAPSFSSHYFSPLLLLYSLLTRRPLLPYHLAKVMIETTRRCGWGYLFPRSVTEAE